MSQITVFLVSRVYFISNFMLNVVSNLRYKDYTLFSILFCLIGVYITIIKKNAFKIFLHNALFQNDKFLALLFCYFSASKLVITTKIKSWNVLRKLEFCCDALLQTIFVLKFLSNLFKLYKVKAKFFYLFCVVMSKIFSTDILKWTPPYLFRDF